MNSERCTFVHKSKLFGNQNEFILGKTRQVTIFSAKNARDVQVGGYSSVKFTSVDSWVVLFN